MVRYRRTSSSPEKPAETTGAVHSVGSNRFDPEISGDRLLSRTRPFDTGADAGADGVDGGGTLGAFSDFESRMNCAMRRLTSGLPKVSACIRNSSERMDGSCSSLRRAKVCFSVFRV